MNDSIAYFKNFEIKKVAPNEKCKLYQNEFLEVKLFYRIINDGYLDGGKRGQKANL